MNNAINEAHPDGETLAALLSPCADGEYEAVRLHVAVCEMCSQKLSRMRRVAQGLVSMSGHAADIASDAGHLSSQQVAQYIDVATATHVREPLDAHVKTCPMCLKAVLRARARRADTQPTLTLAPVPAVLSPPKSETKRRTVPAWTLWPTALAASVVVAVMSSWYFTSTQERGVTGNFVVFQDDPSWVVTPPETENGLGFADAVRHLPFDGIRSQVNETGLSLEWVPVPGVTDYHFTLAPHGAQLSLDQQLSKPKVTLPIAELKGGQRYDWAIAGTLPNGDQFRLQGGLALSGSSSP